MVGGSGAGLARWQASAACDPELSGPFGCLGGDMVVGSAGALLLGSILAWSLKGRGLLHAVLGPVVATVIAAALNSAVEPRIGLDAGSVMGQSWGWIVFGLLVGVVIWVWAVTVPDMRGRH